jgi:NAD(P)-dependent dehydrogenase (short-subunit alcohol dehydrogenase family)
VKTQEGKVILITGAGSGIGRAAAIAFAREGAQVAVADVSEQGGEQTVAMIKEASGQAFFAKVNVAEARDVARMVNRAVETYGKLDYAFNNAGIEGEQVAVADYAEGTWNRVIGVNLTGIWLCMKHEIPPMLKQGKGVIVNMSSILGTVGFANASAYVASKHGVIGLTKTAALEYASKGIRVNAICPGFIETPMLERAGMSAGSELYRQIASLHPLKRLGKPEEIAQAVVWLCSDAASFVTGHAMLVDGGYVAQ